MTRKPGLGSLLLLGAAAFGAYKYSQMTDQQKKTLVNKGKDLLGKGKKLVNDNFSSVTDAFSQARHNASANGSV